MSIRFLSAKKRQNPSSVLDKGFFRPHLERPVLFALTWYRQIRKSGFMPVNLVVLSKASNIGRSRTFQKREEAIKKIERRPSKKQKSSWSMIKSSCSGHKPDGYGFLCPDSFFSFHFVVNHPPSGEIQTERIIGTCGFSGQSAACAPGFPGAVQTCAQTAWQCRSSSLPAAIPWSGHTAASGKTAG